MTNVRVRVSSAIAPSISADYKIRAIRALRFLTDAGLKEAKDFVEQVLYRPEWPTVDLDIPYTNLVRYWEGQVKDLRDSITDADESIGIVTIHARRMAEKVLNVELITEDQPKVYGNNLKPLS